MTPEQLYWKIYLSVLEAGLHADTSYSTAMDVARALTIDIIDPPQFPAPMEAPE